MSEDKLQAYVLGELPPGEAEEIAKAIAEDPTLRARELRLRIIRRGFRRERVTEMKKQLLTYDKTLLPSSDNAPAAAPKEKPVPRKKISAIRKWWPLGMVGILLLLAGGYFMTIPGPPSLHEDFFEMPGNDNVASSTDDDILYVEAKEQFFGDRFAEAHDSFIRLRSRNESYRSLANYYLPHASFRLGKHDRAATEFNTALQDDNLAFIQQSLLRWNAMINRLARGEDISAELAQEWPPGFRRDELEQALSER